MKTSFQKQIDYLSTHPRKLFLLDGIGAIVSAFFLGIVLVQINGKIGLPVSTLYILAAMAVFFAIYSLSCYFFVKKNEYKFLAFIAVVNLLYSCFTTFLLFYHAQQVLLLGWVYFILEIIVLFVIVSIEFKVVQSLKR